MNVKYYKDDDILVVHLSDEPIDHAQDSGNTVVHFDREDNLVRIEFLEANQFFKLQNRALPDFIKQEFFAI